MKRAPGRICIAVFVILTTASVATEIPDVITADAARFSAMLASRVPERRIEGMQGLAHMKHWRAEAEVVPLLDDPSPEVRREALLALGRLGGVTSVPRLISLLGDSSWELRQNAWLTLCAMTAQHFSSEDRSAWAKWWKDSSLDAKELELLNTARQLPKKPVGSGTNAAPTHAAFVSSAPGRRGRQRAGVSSPANPRRREALRALARLATRSSEEALLNLLGEPQSPSLDIEERNFICQALERVGSSRAIPVLAAQQSDSASWALAQIGGDEAERALLKFPKTLPVLLALDRMRSTNTAPLIPLAVSQMAQITYRSHPDDVMNDDLQPIQRVAVNLIRRSGLAPAFIECVVQELEDTMKPPTAHAARPLRPPEWDELFKRMRSELKPGFVREDGVTTSQPIVAMCYLADSYDAALVKRLVPLLNHRAVVPRVYVALALGRMHAHESLPALTRIIEEGYPFSDSTALASGKHFDQSQTVRWHGFLCMALGRMGSEEARIALERYASDPKQPRDVRYGSVVGLRFIGSPKSLPVLDQATRDDVIWMVRDEARRAGQLIRLLDETHVAKQ